MDLIDAYGYRLISGFDKNLFLDETSNLTIVNKNINAANNQGILVIDEALNKTVCKIGCIYHYLEPIKRYWKISPNDSCIKKRKAIGAEFSNDNNQHNCVSCFRGCILKNCTIKAPKK